MNRRSHCLIVYLLLAGLVTLIKPTMAAQTNSFDGSSRGNGSNSLSNSSTIPTSTNPSTQTQLSPDAIAIRVFDNSQNLTPRAWYSKNIKAQRSLQSLLVDGYDAVRDDRTVYVAAANIEPCDGERSAINCLKPIMVIISFNQNISNETIDIFGQILANWRFNQNINSQPGVCSNNAASLSCLSNQDCPSGQVCDSLKSKIIRDTKRLIDLSAIKNKLEQYRGAYQRYPSLESGTYLANKTLSVWPSWQKTLAVKLGSALSVDPINKLGTTTTGFSQTTGWNEQQRSFVTTWPSLPANSRVYQYEFIHNTHYVLCANFETNYQNILNYTCASSHENQGPVINCSTMRTAAGQPFTAYADIFDNEGDGLNPNITYSQLSVSGWSPLTLQLVNHNQQIKITAAAAGPDGRYDLVLNAQDNLGATTSKTCTIIVGNGLCGNNTIDPGENCEGALGVAADANTSNSSHQYSCNQYCRFTGGWCGDNIIQNGQNFTINREQCDGSHGVATRTNDSNSNRQYGCVQPANTDACTFTGGYCGDHLIQTSTNNQINEDCDRTIDSPNPSPSTTYNGVQRYQCGQPGTTNACKFTGGYCGDKIVDYGYGETCESATYINPTMVNSSSTKQYSCLANSCQVTGGWCGDGQIQTTTNITELCDCSNNSKNCAWAGNASSSNPNPTATSSPTNLYRCQNCLQTGGWCGDGIVQSQSEKCDPLEPLNTFKSRTGNNNIDQNYYNQFIAACTTQNCQIDCYDKDSDGYGINYYKNCGVNTTPDCEDRPLGSDGLINTPDDGQRMNPNQPDNCTQYDGLDNNCNGLIDDRGWLYNQVWSDNFSRPNNEPILNPAVPTNTTTASTTFDNSEGRSARLAQSMQASAPDYVWPNTCNNLNSAIEGCTDYANKSLTGLTWNISNTELNMNQNYVLSFRYKGSANFLHPTTTNPVNQIHWKLSPYNQLTNYSQAIYTSNLIRPGNHLSFDASPYLGSFVYSQDFYTASGSSKYLSILIGQNNLPAEGNILNIDNVSLTACQNIRPDNTYCGNGVVEGAYETCDFNMTAPNWDEATEFCYDNCQKGRRLKILQVYPGSTSNVDLQAIINNNKDNQITRTAVIATTSITDFRNSPTTYIPTNNPTSLYNVIVFGFKDCNNNKDLDDDSASSTERFINSGGGVIFGHDTIWQEAGTICGGDHEFFSNLAHYAGIRLYDYDGAGNNYSNVSKNINPASTPTSSLMFNYPYIIEDNFTVNNTHTSGSLPDESLCGAADGLKVWFDGGNINTKFWATTCGRIEHIMIGHSSNSINIHEQRALINMLYYVATH